MSHLLVTTYCKVMERIRKPALPVFNSLFMQKSSDTVIMVSTCDSYYYDLARSEDIPTRPHRLTTCPCFLSRLGLWYPSWPLDELDLHFCVNQVMSACAHVLRRSWLNCLGQDCEGPAMLARKVIVEFPEAVEIVTDEARIRTYFHEPKEMRCFVELCVEYFISYNMYDPVDLEAVTSKDKWA